MPAIASGDAEVLGRAAPANLDDRVLAADRVGRAVQLVGRGQAAGELAVPVDVVGIDRRRRCAPRRCWPASHSLTPPSMPVWLWQSIRPGVTCLPVASMRIASTCSGASVDTETTLPSRTSRNPFSTIALRTARPDRGIFDEHVLRLRRSEQSVGTDGQIELFRRQVRRVVFRGRGLVAARTDTAPGEGARDGVAGDGAVDEVPVDLRFEPRGRSRSEVEGELQATGDRIVPPVVQLHGRFQRVADPGDHAVGPELQGERAGHRLFGLLERERDLPAPGHHVPVDRLGWCVHLVGCDAGGNHLLVAFILAGILVVLDGLEREPEPLAVRKHARSRQDAVRDRPAEEHEAACIEGLAADQERDLVLLHEHLLGLQPLIAAVKDERALGRVDLHAVLGAKVSLEQPGRHHLDLRLLRNLVPSTVDPHVANLALLLEQRAVDHHQIRDLARLDRSHDLVEPEHLGRRRRQRRQRRVLAQPVLDGLLQPGKKVTGLLEPMRRQRDGRASIHQATRVRRRCSQIIISRSVTRSAVARLSMAGRSG